MMVADALKFARGQSSRPVFTALLAHDLISSIAARMLTRRLGATHDLRFLFFARSSELLRLAADEPFDLVFLYVGNVEWDVRSDDGSWIGEASVLGELKARCGKPILATQGLDLSAELESKGVLFLETPFTVKEFWQRLDPHLPVVSATTSAKSTFLIKIYGSSPSRDFDILAFARPAQEILGPEYAVALGHVPHLYCKYSNYWDYDYDLLVILLSPGPLDQHDCSDGGVPALIAELKKKSRNPVIVLTNDYAHGLDSVASLEDAGADAFISFLPPFPTDAYRQALQRCVTKVLDLRSENDRKREESTR